MDKEKKGKSGWIDLYRSRRVLVMPLLGFSSGLPLALTGSSLQAWLSVSGISVRTIGILALVALPYTLKFVWSPLMDRFVPPWLGRRRGWIIIAQIVLMLGISAMAFASPDRALFALALLALLVAFASASQDIVIDAYRTDILRPDERGPGAGIYIVGYRVAMLTSGALAFILSSYVGWQTVYLLIAAFMAVGLVTTLFSPEPEEKIEAPRTMREAIWGPLIDYFSRRKAVALLVMIILYKLGDAYAGSLTTVFLLRGPAFSLAEVGTVNKGLGLLSTIVGATVGGTLMARLGLFRALILFGLLQAVSNLSFVVLAWVGKSYPMLITAIAFENLSGGMGSVALVTLVMALCNQRYSATQFALLSSLAVLGRFLVSPTAGFVVEAVGWVSFFAFTTLTALPGLAMVLWLRKEIIEVDGQGKN
jgi:MFS transporter, PAT family, beta-lactamase induction signal transducer AmpG